MQIRLSTDVPASELTEKHVLSWLILTDNVMGNFHLQYQFAYLYFSDNTRSLK